MIFHTQLRSISEIALVAFAMSLLLMVSGFAGGQHQESSGEQYVVADTIFANEYFTKAESLSEKAQYDSAIFYFKKAYLIYEKAAIQKDVIQLWEKYIKCYNHIGNTFRKKGQYEEAKTYLNSAFEVGLDKLKEKHPEVAVSYNNMGLVAWHQGDYDKAMTYHSKALSIRLETLPESHLDVGKSYNNIGVIYFERGEYDKTLDYYQKSLMIDLHNLGEKDLSVAIGYLNIGLVYSNKYDFDNALAFFQKSLSIMLEAVGEKHPLVAKNYAAITQIYVNKSDYGKSLEYNQKALTLNLETLGELHIDVSNAYLSKGTILYKKGNYDQAFVHYQKSLEIRKKILNENHPYFYTNYVGLAAVHLGKDEYDKALEYNEKAVSILFEVFGEEHRLLVSSYEQIGIIYAAKKDYDKALEYFQKMLSLSLKTSRAINSAYQRFGEIYYQKEDWKQSLHYYQKAIISSVRNFDKENIYINPELINIVEEYRLLNLLGAKAEILKQQYLNYSKDINDLHHSITTFELAAELLDKMRSGYKSEVSQLNLAKEVNLILGRAIHAALLLYEKTQENIYLEKAFYFSEKAKSAILSSALAEANAKQFANIPDSLLVYEKDLKIDLSFYERSLAGALAGEHGDSSKISLWQNKVFSLNQARDSLIYQLEKDYPRYYELKYQTKTANVTDVQKQLPDTETLLVEYFLSDTLLYIFTISHESIDATSVPIDSGFAVGLQAFRQTLFNASPKEYADQAFQLYNVLLKPIEKHLAERRRLMIIPDGLLSYLPFGALLTEKNMDSKNANFSKLPYLIKKYKISYHYSASLLNMDKYSDKRPDIGSFIGFAPVSFHKPDFEINGTISKWIAEWIQQFKESASSLFRSSDGRAFPNLPQSETEVTRIADMFREKGKIAHTHLYTNAREANLKSVQTNHYKYVHIASHGVINTTEPKLSGILLTPEEEGAAEDGVLYSGETYNLNLNADLLVLSACESGLGSVVRGEGIIGLAHGFFYAGAKNIVASLWRVADKPTEMLMVTFYENLLNGANYADALRQAKLKMIASDQYNYPAHWCAFVLIGR